MKYKETGNRPQVSIINIKTLSTYQNKNTEEIFTLIFKERYNKNFAKGQRQVVQ